MSEDKKYVVIAYWGREKDVLWTEGDEPDSYGRISDRLIEFICEGKVTEILEVFEEPPFSPDHDRINDRVNYWRDTLHEQGYEIRRYM